MSSKHIKRIVSRIENIAYRIKDKRLYFVLKDSPATYWIKIEDEDEANHLSARFGREMNKDFLFVYNYNNAELVTIPEVYESSCSIS